VEWSQVVTLAATQVDMLAAMLAVVMSVAMLAVVMSVAVIKLVVLSVVQ
jgi:hypothetical protein